MRLVDAIVRLIPFKQTLCAWAAVCPVRYRNRLSYRLFAKFARTLAQDSPQLHLVSNLGISDALRVSLPIQAQANYLFGRPEDYAGERCVLFLARHLARDCDAIADIGANWGYHTFFLSVAAPTLPIYSFEPNASLSTFVSQTAADNHLPQVHCVNAAIAERSGSMNFYLNTSDDLSSSLTDVFALSGHQVEKTTVSALSFDDFRARHPHQRWLLKVDVESAEFQFLAGAMSSIAQGSVRYLIIELLTAARKDGFVARMLGLGFYAYYLNDLHIEQVLGDDGRSTPGEYNWLFSMDSPTELTERMRGSQFQVVAA